MEWQVLRESGGTNTIVALDFGLRRREAGFPDLAGRLAVPGTLVKPGFGDPGLDPDLFCRALLDQLGRSGRRVVGVIGYCTSAALACLMGEAATPPGESGPQVVLFDPTQGDPSALRSGYLAGIDGLRADLTDQEYQAARSVATGGAATPSAGDAAGLAGLVRTLGEGYLRCLTASGERLGIEAAVRDELAAHFTAYLGYLATTALAETRPPRGAAGQAPPVVLASRDHQVPPRWADHLHCRFPVTRADLLADDQVAAVTDSLLARATLVG